MGDDKTSGRDVEENKEGFKSAKKKFKLVGNIFRFL